MAEKLSIRTWLWSQHVPAEVMADFDKLFGLAEDLRTRVLLTDQTDAQALDGIADELDMLLGKNS